MQFFGNRKLLILLISLILMVVIMGYSQSARDYPSLPEKFARDTAGLLQSVLYRPTYAIASFFQEVRNAYRIYEENKDLKANLDHLAQVTAEVNELRSENKELREMLQVKANLSNYQMRVAEVIGRSPDRWNNIVIINKGKGDGIRPNMAVYTPQGLIGRILSVSEFSSQVELLTDSNRIMHYSARIQGDKPVHGIIEEFDEEAKRLILRKIPLGETVKEGSLVVTSGLGGVIPGGLLIGKVTDVVPGEFDLTNTAYVEPTADFSRLRFVFVIERSLNVSPAAKAKDGQP